MTLEEYQEAAAECDRLLVETGKRYARLLCHRLSIGMLEPELIIPMVDYLVGEFESDAKEAGICENDIGIGANRLRAVILTEGMRVTEAMGLAEEGTMQ